MTELFFGLSGCWRHGFAMHFERVGCSATYGSIRREPDHTVWNPQTSPDPTAIQIARGVPPQLVASGVSRITLFDEPELRRPAIDLRGCELEFAELSNRDPSVGKACWDEGGPQAQQANHPGPWADPAWQARFTLAGRVDHAGARAVPARSAFDGEKGP